MRKKLVLVFAAGLAVAMMTWQAQAMPSLASKQVYQGKNITLVAEGCGPGWHWSVRWRRCVRN
jgi:hypothetical protein